MPIHEFQFHYVTGRFRLNAISATRAYDRLQASSLYISAAWREIKLRMRSGNIRCVRACVRAWASCTRSEYVYVCLYIWRHSQHTCGYTNKTRRRQNCGVCTCSPEGVRPPSIGRRRRRRRRRPIIRSLVYKRLTPHS